MNAAFIRIGVTGCDIGASYLLPCLVGASIASELLLTGRFMHDMLQASPLGLRLTKDALNFNIDAPSLDASMAKEDRQQVLLSLTDDYVEARTTFLGRRTPTFHDR